MDGILNINKPRGKTSFSMVAMVRKLAGERRVGHGGTLDPEASGVLPLCLGQGTRVVEFLLNLSKVYRAEISLGMTTDTYDATGEIICRRDPSGISWERLESALAPFCGLVKQTPPMYSALKYHGRRLYELARAGITVSRDSRLVRIYSLKLIDFSSPLVTIEVECGRGTYIRSLAHDLGELLGCGAHLKSLVRLRYGPFDIAEAVSPSQLEDSFSCGSWRSLVYPIDSVLLGWPAVVVGGDEERVLRHGSPLVLGDVPHGASYKGRCRAYSLGGDFLAVLHFNSKSGQWQPEKVLV